MRNKMYKGVNALKRATSISTDIIGNRDKYNSKRVNALKRATSISTFSGHRKNAIVICVNALKRATSISTVYEGMCTSRYFNSRFEKMAYLRH